MVEGEAADCLKPQLPSMWYSDALEQTLRSKRWISMAMPSKCFFQRSRLCLQTWVKLMYLWAVDAPVTKLQEQLDEGECSTKSAIDVFNFLREVCTNKLIAMGNIRLGGPNVIVQIDESLFNHKPKYHHGRRPHHEQWVYGLVDTSTRPCIGYMELVGCRNAATLLPIIRDHTQPGTIVHSDQWRAYAQIQSSLNLQHSTVNHSRNFVDPSSGVHTQAIEGYWSRVKAKLKRMRGTTPEMLPGYLDEFMWRERFACNSKGELDRQWDLLVTLLSNVLFT